VSLTMFGPTTTTPKEASNCVTRHPGLLWLTDPSQRRPRLGAAVYVHPAGNAQVGQVRHEKVGCSACEKLKLSGSPPHGHGISD
jgi:hypothetical protein